MSCFRLSETARLAVFLAVTTAIFACAGSRPEEAKVRSRDGTLIALQCAGRGPNLILVHGGTGDRTRWTPMLPLLSSRFSVCAMDRRGHGDSGDSPEYSLQKEAEDVAAVADSRGGPVAVLGHSYGGVAALEAAFLTKHISKLILYEAPLQDSTDLAVVEKDREADSAGRTGTGPHDLYAGSGPTDTGRGGGYAFAAVVAGVGREHRLATAPDARPCGLPIRPQAYEHDRSADPPAHRQQIDVAIYETCHSRSAGFAAQFDPDCTRGSATQRHG
jgi:pimeloyl-ACP methyl ester carboxylesterase